jgi:hypothetical protein
MNELQLPQGNISRKQVIEFEKLMQRGEKIDVAIKDYFVDGLYAREAFIPKGVILTGMIHKYENLNIMSKGVMDVLVDGQMQRVWAPFTTISPPGIKRIARAIEDTVWTTILRTDLKSVDEIWKYFVTNDEEEYLEFINKEPLLPFKVLQNEN